MAAPIYGTTGNDTLDGTSGTDLFYAWQGGSDTVNGDDGDDIANFANNFTQNDVFNGGNGNDVLRLSGNAYSDGITYTSDNLNSVEQIQLGNGHGYNITIADLAVASGSSLTLNAASLTGDSALTADASGTTGSVHFVGGAGDDTFTGNDSGNLFLTQRGGADTVHGGTGNDVVVTGDSFNANDAFDGGDGYDRVTITGYIGNANGGDTLAFNASTLTHVEKLELADTGSYSFISDDGNVAAGATMEVDGSHLGIERYLTFDGSAETDGRFILIGGVDNDVLTGGAKNDTFILTQGGNDTVTGGLGADVIVALGDGSDFDTFIYNSAADSTGTHHDTIKNVNFQTDTFVAPQGSVDVENAFFAGKADQGHFDADAVSFMDASRLTLYNAAIWNPQSGSLAGHAYLFIDVNGTAGYQAGQDVVIDVTGYTGLTPV
ncbi:MAG TPA: calcium-binding protein [Rhizomicrobium sp.]|jgi:Ca2+-binding RTX toxin-like protein